MVYACMCICICTCVCICTWIWICTCIYMFLCLWSTCDTRVEIRGQSLMLLLTFHFIWDMVSLLLTTGYTRLREPSFNGFSNHCLPSSYRNTGITGKHRGTQLYVGAGDLKSDSHACMTSTLPKDPNNLYHTLKLTVWVKFVIWLVSID